MSAIGRKRTLAVGILNQPPGRTKSNKKGPASLRGLLRIRLKPRLNHLLGSKTPGRIRGLGRRRSVIFADISAPLFPGLRVPGREVADYLFGLIDCRTALFYRAPSDRNAELQESERSVRHTGATDMVLKAVNSVAGPLQPATWGKDRLSAYLDSAYRNRLATFANMPADFARLTAIDACFADATTDWQNPKQPIVALLLIRTLGSYRAACEAAMAGQIVETFVLIRAMIEGAGYAAHIHRKPELEALWLRRHDEDHAIAKASKDAFKVSAVRSSIQAADQAAATRFDRIYQEAIDFGAHPNERSITGNTRKIATTNGAQFEHLLLQGNGMPMDYALITTARAGVLSLDIFDIPLSARFSLLGIKERMLKLREGL